MADHGLQDHGSSSSAVSTNNNLRLLAQDVQRIFRIPHKVTLEMLLANLGLEPAQYKRTVNDDGKIRITVLFNTAALDLGDTIIDVTVPGDYCTDDEAAEDTAAIKAVRYIETMTNTVVRDLNHTKTKRQQRRISSLEKQLKRSNAKGKRLARDDADDMEIVEVSGTFLLGGMLDKLNLPCPRYHSKTHRKGQFVTEVTFYPSMEHLRHPPTPVTLSSSPLRCLQRTIEVVSTKAIQYMENHQRKVMQDYSYIELKRSEAANSDLTKLLTEKNRNIKELKKSFGDYINAVSLACDQICQLAISESAALICTANCDIYRNISRIQAAVAELNRLSHESIQLLNIAFSHAEEDNNGNSVHRVFDL